jgi:hypothetical protein
MKALGGSKTKTARIQIEDLSATLDIYRLEVGPLSHHQRRTAGPGGKYGGGVELEWPLS